MEYELFKSMLEVDTDEYRIFCFHNGGEFQTLKRFLISRNYNYEEAKEMFEECILYKKKNGFLRYNPDLSLDKNISQYWIGRIVPFTTIDNSSILYIKYSNEKMINIREKFSFEDVCNFYMIWIERYSKHRNKINGVEKWDDFIFDYSKSFMIIDISEISLFDPGIENLNFITSVLETVGTKYVEFISKVFLVNVTYGLYVLLNSFLASGVDQRVRDKIHVSYSDEKELFLDMLGSPSKYDNMINSINIPIENLT